MKARGNAKQRATGARYTRAQVARVLGVNRRTVQRLEGVELHPAIEKGVHRFEPDEVHAYAKRRDQIQPLGEGELAAAVFSQLQAGRQLTDIVLELRVPPRVVRELHREWKLDLETGYSLRLEGGHC